jgi:hypothetical protein
MARVSAPSPRPGVRDVVADLHRRYYPAGDYSGEIERQTFNVSLVRSRLRDGQTVCDIGALGTLRHRLQRRRPEGHRGR